jgi:allophanate hydrolase subunit 1
MSQASRQKSVRFDLLHLPSAYASESGSDNGEVIGVTTIDAQRVIQRDGYLTTTLPHSVRVEADELAAALI